jgi:hypothetical protein
MKQEQWHMLWEVISVTEVILLLLGGTTLTFFRKDLVLTGVHARTFPDVLIEDLSPSFYKQVKAKRSIWHLIILLFQVVCNRRT